MIPETVDKLDSLDSLRNLSAVTWAYEPVYRLRHVVPSGVSPYDQHDRRNDHAVR